MVHSAFISSHLLVHPWLWRLATCLYDMNPSRRQSVSGERVSSRRFQNKTLSVTALNTLHEAVGNSLLGERSSLQGRSCNSIRLGLAGDIVLQRIEDPMAYRHRTQRRA